MFDGRHTKSRSLLSCRRSQPSCKAADSWCLAGTAAHPAPALHPGFPQGTFFIPSREDLFGGLDAEEDRSRHFPKLSVCNLFLSINLPLVFVVVGSSKEWKEG